MVVRRAAEVGGEPDGASPGLLLSVVRRGRWEEGRAVLLGEVEGARPLEEEEGMRPWGEEEGMHL